MRVPLNLLRRRRGDNAMLPVDARLPEASATAPTASAPPRRSFRLRYTLRALLIFISLFMLWGGYHTNRAWNERTAETQLLARGAKVTCAPSVFDQRRRAVRSYSYNDLAGTLWGERFIVSVSITSSLEPEVVQALTRLPYLQSLEIKPALRRSPDRRFREGELPPMIAPSGAIAGILQRHDLTSLRLDEWMLHDGDIDAISNEHTLDSLSLDFTALNEESLAKLLGLPKLREFSFDRCPATGRLLKQLQGSHTLEKVECRGTPVGSEFAKFIARSPNVHFLMASHSSIGDEFILALGPHPSLTDLSVTESRISDASISVIEQMPRLISLHVVPEFTTCGAARLKRASPTLRF